MVERGVGEKRIELETRASLRGKTGDEFAADAMTGVIAGFEKRDLDTGATEGDPETQTGETAADDFDGAAGFHGRRTATRW